MTALLLENMAYATLTLLLVLALRRAVAALFGAGWAYALWLLPALRLVAPPLPDLGAGLDLLPPLTSVISLSGDSAAPMPPQGGSGQWMSILLAVWAVGAAVFLVRQWLAYRRFLTRLSLSAKPIGAYRGLPLIESALGDGPLAVGLLDRRIVVPADFKTRYAPDERRLALEHEAAHHRRGDMWWNLAAILFLAANWFNPIAWAAFRAFRTDQELACDAAVAAAASPEERHHYARALVKSASRPGLIAACPLGSRQSSTLTGSRNHADQLKRRLKMMKNHRTSRLRNAGGVATLGAAILATAGFGTAAAQERREADGKQREHIVIMDRHGQGAQGGQGQLGSRDIVIRRGPNGELQVPENCGGSVALSNVDERTGEQRTRILLCSRDEQTGEQRLQGLQRARDRLAQNGEMRPEHRERVLQALDRELARLRGR